MFFAHNWSKRVQETGPFMFLLIEHRLANPFSAQNQCREAYVGGETIIGRGSVLSTFAAGFGRLLDAKTAWVLRVVSVAAVPNWFASGAACKHCHLCDSGEIQRRRKMKQSMMRDLARFDLQSLIQGL